MFFLEKQFQKKLCCSVLTLIIAMTPSCGPKSSPYKHGSELRDSEDDFSEDFGDEDFPDDDYDYSDIDPEQQSSWDWDYGDEDTTDNDTSGDFYHPRDDDRDSRSWYGGNGGGSSHIEVRNIDPTSPRYGDLDGTVVTDPGNDKGYIVFEKEALAAIMQEEVTRAPELYSQEGAARDIEAARDGAIQGSAPVKYDAAKDAWVYQINEIKLEQVDDKSSRPQTSDWATGDLYSDSEPTAVENNPTIEYQQGEETPSHTSERPATASGADGKGESIFPNIANAPINREPSSNNDNQDDGRPRGLPGPGDQDRTVSTASELARNYLDDAKRWAKAFAKDLKSAVTNTELAQTKLKTAKEKVRNDHNNVLENLNSRLKIDTGLASFPVSVALPPAKLPSSDYPFKTPRNSTFGEKLWETLNYRNYVASVATNEQQKNYVSIADKSLLVSDQAYTANDLESATLALRVATGVLDVAISITPGIGWAKDVYEAATGKSLLTDEPLGGFERGMAILGAGSLGAASIFKASSKAIKTIRTIAAEFLPLTSKTEKFVKSMEEVIDVTKIERHTAESVNATFPTTWLPPYAPNTTVYVVKTTEPTVWKRLHLEGNQVGRWLSHPDHIKGLNSVEIKNLYSLPELPKYVSDVHLPASVEMRIGVVAESFGGTEGATQMEVISDISIDWFKNQKPLP